jgi:plasmid stabilization system protein ParE
MIRPYALSDRAERDLVRAREWYDRQGRDLGSRFIDSVVAAIQVARENPGTCPVVRKGVPGIRCKRLPYRVYFELQRDRVVAAAVYHTARNPRLWNDPDRP